MVHIFFSPVDFKLSLLRRMPKLTGANRMIMGCTGTVFSVAKVYLWNLSVLARCTYFQQEGWKFLITNLVDNSAPERLENVS